MTSPDDAAVPGHGGGSPIGLLPGPPVRTPARDGSTVELTHYLRALSRRRWTALVVFVAIFLPAVAYLYSQPRVYRATARVQVVPQHQPGVLIRTETPEERRLAMRTQSKIVQSSIMAERAAESLTRAGTPVSMPEVARSLSVTIEEPDVLAISAEHTNPARAAIIANAVQDEYVLFNTSLARAEATSECKYLEGQIARVEGEMKQLDGQIRRFKATHKVPEVDPNQQMRLRWALDYTAEAESARADLQTAVAELEGLKHRMLTQKPTRTVKKVVNDPAADGLRHEYGRLEVELAKARLTYDDEHPKVQALKERLKDMSRIIEERRLTQPEVQVIDVEEPDPTYNALKDRIQEQENRVQALRSRSMELARIAAQKTAQIPKIPQEYADLERLQHKKEASDKALVDFCSKLQEARLKAARTQGTARKVDVARPSRVPIRPRPMDTLPVAVVVALVASIAVALLREHTDSGVHDPEELMLRTGIPSLGFIAAVPKGGFHIKLPANGRSASIAREGFRITQARLQLANPEAPPRTLMVTSSVIGEGKSFTATNMAIVYAQAGIRTILVDADMRRSSIHRAFELKETPGLSDVLEGRVSLAEALQPCDVPNLMVLTGGPVPFNPPALLGSRRMAELLEEMKRHAQVIVFDTPPVLAVADALVLTSQVDATILVVEQGRVGAQAYLEARRMLEEAHGSIAGAVINKVRTRSSDYYRHYHSYYGHRNGRSRHYDPSPGAIGGGGNGAHEPAALPSSTSGAAKT